MKIMKKFLVTFLFATLASVVIINTTFAEILLFVGEGCPHCTNVEAYIEENNLLEKLPITIYEVWENTANQPLFLQKAQEVGYQGQGVPFMVDGNHYEIGDYQIIGYFSDLLENKGDPMTEKLKADSIPVEEPVMVTADESAELNEIMEEKTADGEKSELIDPSTLYDAENGIDKEVAEKINDSDIFKSPILYIAIALVLISAITAFYPKKKSKGKKK